MTASGLEAELVAFGVEHHEQLAVLALDARAQSDESLALGVEVAHDAEVEVLAVLGHLALRDLLEPQARTAPSRASPAAR